MKTVQWCVNLVTQKNSCCPCFEFQINGRIRITCGSSLNVFVGSIATTAVFKHLMFY